MIFTQKEFEKFTEEHGTLRLIAHTVMKNRCSCFDGNEADPECPYCFGTGWKYDWYLTKARRDENSSVSFSSKDKIELDLPFKINTLNFKYYFKSKCNINAWDFILEFMNPSDRCKYVLYFVTNDRPEEGERGIQSYKVVLANKVLINENLIYSALSKIDIERLKKV